MAKRKVLLAQFAPWWDSNPLSQQAAAADPRFRPRGHWDRQIWYHHWRKCEN